MPLREVISGLKMDVDTIMLQVKLTRFTMKILGSAERVRQQGASAGRAGWVSARHTAGLVRLLSGDRQPVQTCPAVPRAALTAYQHSDSGSWNEDSSSKAPLAGFLACVTPGRVSHPPLIIKEAGRPPPIKHHYHLTPLARLPLCNPTAVEAPQPNQTSLPPTSGDRPVAPQRLIIDVCPSAP
ncbi:uncharacterized protein V6R79_020010 [Siganus canaliculatus]